MKKQNSIEFLNRLASFFEDEEGHFGDNVFKILEQEKGKEFASKHVEQATKEFTAWLKTQPNQEEIIKRMLAKEKIPEILEKYLKEHEEEEKAPQQIVKRKVEEEINNAMKGIQKGIQDALK